MKNKLIAILSAVIVLLGGYTATQIGSVTVGNDYTATTTPYDAGWTDQLIRRGSGTLGSIVVTKAGNTSFTIFDATSTRAIYQVGFPTTTKILATIPGVVAAGTFVFDVTYTDGLVMDVLEGTTGSSTITFR